MDLEWLLPEQIEQILKFCELSSVEDLTVAANILETNHWDLEVLLYLFSTLSMTLWARMTRFTDNKNEKLSQPTE